MEQVELHKIDMESSPVYHSLSVEEVENSLVTSSKEGLSRQTAEERLQEYGLNKLTEAEKATLLQRIWRQLNNVVVLVLVIAAIVSGITEEWAELVLIILVLFVNVVIGLVQEGKAEKSAQAIKAMLSSKAIVIRDGERSTIEAEFLVPGDLIFIQSGDRVPADLRLVTVSGLKVQESMLTGESLPIDKKIVKVNASDALGDRKCMAYSATLVSQGQATGIVVATGDNTEIGKISAMVGEIKEQKTNLMRQVDTFGRWVVVFVVILALSTFFLAKFHNKSDTLASIKTAFVIAVASIPEGLPAMLTITLALGMAQMAKRNAIVRQLPCVETLGSVTVICSDKTGTLTKNEMTAVGMRTSKDSVKINGVGYDPTIGSFAVDNMEVADCTEYRNILEGAVLCNDSGLVFESPKVGEGQPQKDPQWTPVGDPTEVALLAAGQKAGIESFSNLRKEFPRIAAIPFESENKFMATLHSSSSWYFSGDKDSSAGTCVMHVKGATDRLLPYCAYQIPNDEKAVDRVKVVPIDREFWLEEASKLSSLGLRVLAICRADIPEILESEFTIDVITKVEPRLVLLGLVAILDPPRDECIPAIKEAHTAGIQVKMITGDHAQTALSIGKMLGIVDDQHPNAITGPELDNMSDLELKNSIMSCNVWARASPENKIRIVRTLQDIGQISSMTGDGVNDAPALRAADIGVAMGITGTDVAKEASKIVLADDNFATIVAAVREGRKVWDNLRKILVFNQPVNFAQGLCIFFSYVFSLSAEPLNTKQILYVNMVTAVTMGLMLAVELPEPNIMERPPRRVGKSLVGKMFLWRCFFVASVLVIFVLSSFHWASTRTDYSLKEKQALAMNVLVFGEMGYSLSCRFTKVSSLHPRVFYGNKMAYVSIIVTIILQLFLTYTPGVQDLFSMDGLDAKAWIPILISMVGTFLIVEIEKSLIDPIFNPILYPFMKWLASFVPPFLSMEKKQVSKEVDRSFLQHNADSK